MRLSDQERTRRMVRWATFIIMALIIAGAILVPVLVGITTSYQG